MFPLRFAMLYASAISMGKDIWYGIDLNEDTPSGNGNSISMDGKCGEEIYKSESKESGSEIWM
jgi:hypothetical protein